MSAPAVSPQVSVVLPTYNRAGTLPRAIHSVLWQTFHDLELIVVDDGSDDGTAELVASFTDPRVRYVHTGGRTGVSRARNLGVENARGPILAFQDSDDEWRVEKLERQLATMAPDVSLVLCGDIVVNDYASSYLGVDESQDVVDLATTVNLRIPGAQCFMVRRTSFEAAGGFDAALDCFEDWELALRLADCGRVLMVNEPLVVRERSADSLFRAEAGHARNLKRILDRHEARLAAEPRIWALYANLIGQSECRHGSMAEGRQWFVKAIRARPRSLRAWSNLCISSLGARAFRRYVDVARAARARFAAPVRQPLHRD